MEQIELTTITQINYHLQMGQYVIFNLKNGFGFLKQDDEDDSGIFNDKGVEIVIQIKNNAYTFEVPNEKGAYVNMINELLAAGVKFFVIPGLKIEEVPA